MAARATPEDVNTLMGTTGVDYTLFINTANSVVNSNLIGLDPPYTEDQLKLIETYLAAHFATLTTERGGIRRQQIGESSESYQTISEKYIGFLTTRFGQQAVALDTSGTLAELAQSGTTRKAEFRVV
ncbi:MAG: hypothetical protein AB7L09_21630 [Nitrospira sp.]